VRGGAERLRRRFLTTRAATLARLQRVNAALSCWDEVEAATLAPEDLRPAVTPPTLSRAAPKELQQLLVQVVGELEDAWERRH
jgi:hypothetical protein